MVLVLDMLDLDMDIPVLDMLDMVVMVLAMVPVLDMLDSDMDIPVLDMLDMVVMDLAMAVLVTMARGLLMLSQRLMLVCTMEDMDMVLVWDMLALDMDIPVWDMLAMVVMDSAMEDTVLDMDVSSMVKQFSYAS